LRYKINSCLNIDNRLAACHVAGAFTLK
jgi:hypothetical protein